MADDVRGVGPVLGRAPELARIEEMVTRLATGRGGVVLLIGPPGIGLTTLLTEALTRAGEAVEDVRAVHVPSGLLEGEATAAVAASVVAGETLRDLGDVVLEVLGELDGTVPADDPRLVQVAVTALRRLSSRRPLLVTLDNLPVADEAVFPALASLAAGIAGAPVLVVLTSHDLPRSSFEDSPVGPLWVRRVPPLEGPDAVALVRRTVGRRVPHPVAAAIARRCGANPGDVVAVCAALEPDQLAGLEPLPEVLPGTGVSAATYRRWWDGLGEQERVLVLGVASAARPERATLEECSGAVLGDVLGPDGEPVLDEEHGLVRASDVRLLSAVRALTPGRELRAALRSLSCCYPEDSLDRAWLSLRAGEPMTTEVLDALVDGAREHLDRGRAETVEALAWEAVQHPGPLVPPRELLVLGGVAALYCGHPARAVTLLTTALAEAPDGLGRIVPLLLVATTYRENAVPHRLVASCLRRLEDPGAAAGIAALAARLCVEYGQGEEARRYLAEAEALAPDDRREPDPDLSLARAMVDRSVRRSADPFTALGVVRPGADLAGWLREVQEVEQLVDAGRWSEARDALADLLARVRRFPAPLVRAQLALAALGLHLAMGEHRRAEEVADLAVTDLLPLHVPRGGAGLALLAQLALLRGRAADAEEWLADLVELTQVRGAAPAVSAALHETLALRSLLAEDPLGAAEHYRRALRAGPVQPSTVLDAVRVRRRTGAGAEESVALLEARAADGDPMLRAALELLRVPATQVVATLAAQDAATLPGHEARLLELAADLVEEHAPRLELLRRSRDLYARTGALGRAAAVDREVAREARSAAPSDLDRLTDDERTVARLVHGGATNKEVAGRLYVSVRTVELRLTSIYRKLGIGTRRELRALAGLARAEVGAGQDSAAVRNARSIVEDVDGV